MSRAEYIYNYLKKIKKIKNKKSQKKWEKSEDMGWMGPNKKANIGQRWELKLKASGEPSLEAYFQLRATGAKSEETWWNNRFFEFSKLSLDKEFENWYVSP